MKELCNEVRQLKENFNSFEISHVPRVCNAFIVFYIYKLASLVLHHRHLVKKDSLRTMIDVICMCGPLVYALVKQATTATVAFIRLKENNNKKKH